MIVATHQLDPLDGVEVEARCQMLEKRLALPASNSADVVILPELIDQGFDLEKIKATAPTLQKSLVIAALQRHADTHNHWILAGCAIREETRIFDACVAIKPGARKPAVIYRKVQLYAPLGESDVFLRGDELVTINIGSFRFGLQICNDLRFPEHARKLAQCGVDAIVYIACWPFPRLGHWCALLTARAIENQIYVIGCNRVGRFVNTVFAGTSCVIDPYGTAICSADFEQDTILVSEITRRRIDQIRQFPGLASAVRLS
jgi:predicted amidohydrolase